MAVERAAKRRRLSPPQSGDVAVPGFAQWDLEQQYEKRPRKKEKQEERSKLPVRSEVSTRWEQTYEDMVDEDDEDDEIFSDRERDDEGVADLQPKLQRKKPKLLPKEEIRQAKEELARIAGLVSESPEEHAALLKSLADIAASDNEVVKKLALGAQLAVYKDIIPGYRIRPLSQDDLQAKLSKDVKALRNFEQSLLKGYKDYVSTIATLSKGDDPGLSSVAVSCTSNLLAHVPHFNCRNDLITVLIDKLSTRNFSSDASKCLETLEHLFRSDEEGHASLEAVTQLTKVMKSKNYHIHESVLNTFLHLRLLSEFAHKASTTNIFKSEDDDGKALASKKTKEQKRKDFRTKRERKVIKERKGIEKEMREADAVVSYEERDKNQAETLKLVFVAYFRILKARTPHLTGAVLEGLAKYAHLINQDFFGDILEALRELLADASSALQADDDEEIDNLSPNRNATRESLLCMITAFALLQGQQDVAKSANSLHLDLNFFITHLYRTLLPLSLDSDIELSAKTAHLLDPNDLPTPSKDSKVNVATTTVLLLRSLSSVLLPPTGTRLVPPVRVAAFTKQLLTLALHLPQKSAIAVVGLLQQVAKVHGKKIAGLWNTEERRGDGVFDAAGGEVESSNPFAATVWEGELLRLHFDPKVREGLKGLEKGILEAR